MCRASVFLIVIVLTISVFFWFFGGGASLDLKNELAVFEYVFSSLASSVEVLPGENYYYFKFWEGGREFWGNIRLEPRDRDEGILNFAYWDFNNPAFSKFKQIATNDGLKIIKLSDFDYSLAFAGRVVEFRLNQISQAPPLVANLRPGEKFLMRTFDESGLPFLLLFDEANKSFLWVLDGNPTIDEKSDFVFYDDKDFNRKVLYGVSAENIKRNNYFDGPFDQLADNFIKGEGIRPYLEMAYPYTKGQIDSFGYFLENGARTSTRVAITPYYAYESDEDLRKFYKSCEGSVNDILRCLTFDRRNKM